MRGSCSVQEVVSCVSASKAIPHFLFYQYSVPSFMCSSSLSSPWSELVPSPVLAATCHPTSQSGKVRSRGLREGGDTVSLGSPLNRAL